MLAKSLVFFSLALYCANAQLFDRLYKRLTRRGVKDTIPYTSQNGAVKLSFSLMVIQVNSLDTQTGDLELDAWLNMQWKDSRLAWKPEEFKNITEIRMRHTDFWVPDIVPFNARAQLEFYDGVVTHDGSVVMVPKSTIKSRCDITNYTSDDTATCRLKFGSWTYNGLLLDPVFGYSDGLDVTEYAGGHWELVGHAKERIVKKYTCCPEPYPNLEVTLVFKDTADTNGQMFDGLYKKLVKRGTKNTIPVRSHDQGINVTLSLNILQVNLLDPETGDLDLETWPNMQWNDGRLTWKPEDYNNVTSIRLQPTDFWRPDLVPFNGRAEEEAFDGVVYNDGSVHFVPKTSMKTRCDISNYTSDSTVTCNLKIGSWTYDGFLLNLLAGRNGAVDIAEYRAGRWELLSYEGTRTVSKYECCPEPYPNLSISLVFKDTRGNNGYFNIF